MGAGDVEVNITSPNAQAGAIFDGVDDKVTIADDASLDLDADFSFSCRFRTKNLINDQIIFTKSTGQSTHGGFLIRIGFADFVEIKFMDGAIPSPTCKSTTPIIVDEWTHIVITRTGTGNLVAGQVKIYINGVEDTVAETDYGTPLLNNALDIVIGLTAAGLQPFEGSINNIRIHKKALSQDEVTDLYNNTNVDDKLQNHWELTKDYIDSISSKNGTNSGSMFGIVEQDISAAVKADRTTANDIYLIAETGKGKQAITTIIEET